jgi:hypothetical protein
LPHRDESVSTSTIGAGRKFQRSANLRAVAELFEAGTAGFDDARDAAQARRDLQTSRFVKKLVFLCALFVACWAWAQPIMQFSPATSGVVSIGGSSQQPLTEERLSAVSDWLAAHRLGWHAMVATAPAPYAAIELRHPGGERTALDVYHSPPSPPGWDGAIVLRQFAAGKLAHSGEQKLSAKEAQEFLRLIGR